MNIEAIRLKNWMAFRGEFDLDPLPAAPIAIIGRYTENRRRSNWSGKTALLEAIMFALFGVHRKRLADGVIHRGTDEMFVRVRLSGGIVIRRARTRGKPTELTVAIGSDISTGTAAEQRILDVFGMSHGDFVATQCFEQGDTESIIGREAGERRRVVSRWLELEVWDRLGARARALSAAAATKIRTLATIAAHVPEVVDVAALELEASGLDGKIKEAADELARWDREAAKLRDASRDEQAEPDLRRAAQEMGALRGTPGAAFDPVVLAERQAVLETLGGERSAAADEVERTRRLLASGFDGRCPVVRASCPSATWVSQQGAAAKTNAEEAAAKYQDVCARYDAVKHEVRDLLTVRDDATRRTTRIEALTKTMHELRGRVDARKARLADVTLDASTIDEQRQRVTTSLATVRARVDVIGRDLQRARSDAKRTELETANRSAAERESRIALLVARALSPSGIAARIASAQLRGLEERANILLAGTGLSFELGWERETKDPAPMCEECGFAFKGKRDKACPSCNAVRGMKRSDELEILVEDGSGEIEDVRAKSGGAKVLVASAVRLAGGAMLRELRGSPVRFAIVDEPFGPLDAENREGLARSFAGMLGSVGLEQAFVVSHDAALLDAMPVRIIVTRERGFSKLHAEV